MRISILFFVILLSLISNISQAAPIQGLVLYFQFDEGEGNTTKDLSGNGNDGTLMGQPEWVDGKNGFALQFSGERNSDYVEVPDNPSLTPAQELSFAAWIYFDTFIGSGGIVSKYIGAGSQRSYTMHLHHDNPLGLAVDCSADGSYQAGVTAVSVGTEAGALVESEWQHVAMTFRAKDMLRLYVNGEMKAEGGADPVDALFDNDVPLLVGNDFQLGGSHRAGQPREFTGIIDEVAIFNRVLSEAEIQQVMNAMIMPVESVGKLAAAWGAIKKL